MLLLCLLFTNRFVVSRMCLGKIERTLTPGDGSFTTYQVSVNIDSNSVYFGSDSDTDRLVVAR